MENTTTSTGNKPEKKFSTGAITATVWKNTGTNKENEPVEYRTVSFERSYMDKKTGEWKTTNSLRVSDLPKAVLVLNKAYEFTMLRDGSAESGTENIVNDSINEEIVM